MLEDKIQRKCHGEDAEGDKLPNERAADRHKEGDEGDCRGEEDFFLFENDEENESHDRKHDPYDGENQRQKRFLGQGDFVSAVANRVDRVVAVFVAQKIDILHEDIVAEDIAAEGAVVLVNAVTHLERGEGIADVDGILFLFFMGDGLRVCDTLYVNVVYLLRCEIAEGFVGSEVDVAVKSIEIAALIAFGKRGEILYEKFGKRHVVGFVLGVFQIIFEIDRLIVVGV